MTIEDTTNTTAPTQTTAGDPLGENGVKALEAERKRAKAAEKEAATLQARLDALETANLDAAQRIERERDALRDELATSKLEAMRARVASRFGVSEEDADLFLTAADEDSLIKQATRFAAATKAAGPAPTEDEDDDEAPTAGALFVPAEGKEPVSLNDPALLTMLKSMTGVR